MGAALYHCAQAGSQYDAKQCVALHCVAFTSMLIETHHNSRIDSDPILAFVCVAFLCLTGEKSLEKFFGVSRINATQGLASLCEPAFVRTHQ